MVFDIFIPADVFKGCIYYKSVSFDRISDSQSQYIFDLKFGFSDPKYPLKTYADIIEISKTSCGTHYSMHARKKFEKKNFKDYPIRTRIKWCYY